MFDQISIILSEKVYQHLKDCAAFLELPPQYRLVLQQKRPQKFQLDQERFAVALSQKHIALLGRYVNLSMILGQSIGNYFMADLQYIVRKFETSGLETIVDLEYSLRVMRRMHGLLQQSLGGQLDEFETMLNCTNETVGATSFSGRIVQHVQDELIEELFPWYIYNSGTRRYVRVPGAEAGDRGSTPKKAYNFFGWGVKCHRSFEAFMKVRRHFVGVSHIESIVRVVGSSELPALVTDLLDSVVETLIAYVCPALERVGPDLQPQKLPSATTAMASCCEMMYMRVHAPLQKLKDNVELRPVVMHSMRQLGNALAFLRLLEDVVSVEESRAFLQVGPLLSSNKKTSAKTPLREVVDGLEEIAAQNGRQLSKGTITLLTDMASSAEKLYAPLEQKVQLLPQALRLIKQVLDGGDFESLRGRDPSNGALDHSSKESRLEFHRIWSSIYFMYCMHDSESGGQDDSRLGDAKFGDGFFWSACTLLHLLGQRERFELMDLSYYLLTQHEIESEAYPPNPNREKLIQSLQATGMGHELRGIPFFFRRVQQTRKLINLIFGQLEMSGVHSDQKVVSFAAPKTDGEHSKKTSIRQASRRNNQAVAKYDYDAQNDGELSFSKGQRVQILDQTGDWWVGLIDGTQGLVPSTHFHRR